MAVRGADPAVRHPARRGPRSARRCRSPGRRAGRPPRARRRAPRPGRASGGSRRGSRRAARRAARGGRGTRRRSSRRARAGRGSCSARPRGRGPSGGDRRPEQVARRQDRHAEMSARIGAWVPFPAPGAPRRTTTVMGSRVRSADESFVVPHEELRLDLLHRLDDDADHDQEARAAERDPGQRREEQADDRRQRRDDAEEQGAGDRDPGDDPGQVVGGRAARPDARDEPAVLAELLRGLVRFERERRVEVREADGQQEVQQDVDGPLRTEELDDPARRCSRRSRPRSL